MYEEARKSNSAVGFVKLIARDIKTQEVHFSSKLVSILSLCPLRQARRSVLTAFPLWLGARSAFPNDELKETQQNHLAEGWESETDKLDTRDPRATLE